MYKLCHTFSSVSKPSISKLCKGSGFCTVWVASTCWSSRPTVVRLVGLRTSTAPISLSCRRKATCRPAHQRPCHCTSCTGGRLRFACRPRQAGRISWSRPSHEGHGIGRARTFAYWGMPIHTWISCQSTLSSAGSIRWAFRPQFFLMVRVAPSTVSSPRKTYWVVGIAQRSSSWESCSVMERAIRPRLAHENGAHSPSRLTYTPSAAHSWELASSDPFGRPASRIAATVMGWSPCRTLTHERCPPPRDFIVLCRVRARTAAHWTTRHLWRRPYGSSTMVLLEILIYPAPCQISSIVSVPMQKPSSVSEHEPADASESCGWSRNRAPSNAHWTSDCEGLGDPSSAFQGLPYHWDRLNPANGSECTLQKCPRRQTLWARASGWRYMEEARAPSQPSVKSAPTSQKSPDGSHRPAPFRNVRGPHPPVGVSEHAGAIFQ